MNPCSPGILGTLDQTHWQMPMNTLRICGTIVRLLCMWFTHGQRSGHARVYVWDRLSAQRHLTASLWEKSRCRGPSTVQLSSLSKPSCKMMRTCKKLGKTRLVCAPIWLINWNRLTASGFTTASPSWAGCGWICERKRLPSRQWNLLELPASQYAVARLVTVAEHLSAWLYEESLRCNAWFKLGNL